MSEKRSGKALILAGLMGSAALTLATTDTFAAFTAAITNDKNTATVAGYSMKELSADDSIVCTSASGAAGSATCSSINKYGGATLKPGESVTTTVKIQNVGAITPSAFTVQGGTCAQSGTAPASTTASDLCSKLKVKVYEGANTSGTLLIDSTLQAFGTAAAKSLTALAPNQTQPYTFVVTLDSSVDSSYGNLTASQPITWQFS